MRRSEAALFHDRVSEILSALSAAEAANSVDPDIAGALRARLERLRYHMRIIMARPPRRRRFLYFDYPSHVA